MSWCSGRPLNAVTGNSPGLARHSRAVVSAHRLGRRHVRWGGRGTTRVAGRPVARLDDINGLGDAAITELKVVQASANRLLRGALGKPPTLSSWSAVPDYCRNAQAFADREQFRVLFLDKRNQLADEVQQVGTVDHSGLSARGVVKRALELSATAVILVHNHPSGDPTPSPADIKMTQQIIAVASPLGIAVHDHIVVGKDGHTSFKGLGLI